MGVMETVRSKAKDAIMMAQDKLKNVDGAKVIEDTIKGQARGQIDKMWKTRSQIIETAGNTAKDIMKDQIIETARNTAKDIMKDRLENAVKGHELHGIYKNRDQIMKKVGNKVKDAVKIAVKRRTEDAIEGRVDKIKWTNQGEIIEATRNIVKDATKKAEDKLKNAHDGAKAIEDAVKGQGHGQMDNILKDGDQIIETAKNKVKDVTMMAQDKLKKAGDSANAIKDAVKGQGQIGSMWKNRDQIIETAGNEAKDVTTMAQDKLKKAGDGAKGIKDDVKGQVDDQIDNVWKNHDEIIDTTQNMVKDVTKVAGARGLKGRVEGQIANLWKNRGKIF